MAAGALSFIRYTRLVAVQRVAFQVVLDPVGVMMSTKRWRAAIGCDRYRTVTEL